MLELMENVSPPGEVLGRTGRTVVPRLDLPRDSCFLTRPMGRTGAYQGKRKLRKLKTELLRGVLWSVNNARKVFLRKGGSGRCECDKARFTE